MNKSIIENAVTELVKIKKDYSAKRLLDECCECHMSWAGSWHPDTALEEVNSWISIYEKFGYDYPESIYDYLCED